MLQLQLQGVAEGLGGKIQLFEDDLQQEREKFLQELCDVEGWLVEVDRVLLKEPNREFMPSFTRHEVQAMEKEYSDTGVNTLGAAQGEGEFSLEQVKRDPGDGEFEKQQQEVVKVFDFPREVSISGSSLGSEILELNIGQDQLETSVDVELEDEEYEQEVLQRVLSGSSSPSSHSSSSSSSSSSSPSPLERPDPLYNLGDPFRNPAGPLDSSADPVGAQWAEGMEEEESDAQTETASISSGSTLRGDAQGLDKSPESIGRTGAEFSEKGVNLDGVEVEVSFVHVSSEGEGDSGESEGGEESGGREVGKSLADELSEIGVELEQGPGEDGVKSDEEPEAEQRDQESGG